MRDRIPTFKPCPMAGDVATPIIQEHYKELIDAEVSIVWLTTHKTMQSKGRPLHCKILKISELGRHLLYRTDQEAVDVAIVLPVLEEISERANSVALTRVPRNISHCDPDSAQNQLVSPLLVSPVVAFATPTYPVTGPVSVRFPVPVVLVVSLHRSITLWAMPTPYRLKILLAPLSQAAVMSPPFVANGNPVMLSM